MKTYWATGLGIIAMIWLTIMPYCAFMLVFFIPIVGISRLWGIWQAYRYAKCRHQQFYQTLAWLIALMSMVAVHLYYAQQAQQHAQHVAHALLVYRQKYQQYPNQLSDAHIDAGTDFRSVFYRKSAEEMPILFYRTTFIPFDTYRYNFVTQQSE